MRIAHITATFPPHYTGTGMVAYFQARELARRGHQVEVFTADYGLRDEAYRDPEELTVHRLPSLIHMGNAPLTPGLLKLRKDFDLLHLHYPYIFGAELTAVSAKALGTPYVISHHNDLIAPGLRGRLFKGYTRLVGRWVVRGADKFLAVSEDHFLHCELANEMQGRMEDLVEVPNGVDVMLFSPGEKVGKVRESLGIGAETFVIGFVGVLDQAHFSKGVPFLLEAAAQLSELDTALLVIGDGDLRAEYQAQAGELGIAPRANFTGRVAHHLLPEYYQACDLVVLPSTLESFGIVLIEAMACGVPVIASNIPGVRTVVPVGEAGYLVEPGDVPALAQTIQSMHDLPDRGAQMGQNGRSWVEARYSWPAVVTGLEEIYARVLAERGKRQ